MADLFRFFKHTGIGICFFVLNFEKAYSKNNSRNPKNTDIVFTAVEKQAEPKIGLNQLFSRISKELTRPPGYPEVSGSRVVVRFVVEKDGSVTNFETLKDPTGTKHLYSNQIAKIIASCKWEPATMNNKAVRSYLSLPLTIDLQQE